MEKVKENEEWVKELLEKKNKEYIKLRNEADQLTAAAKYYATNAAFDSANRTVQILGSVGYSKKQSC